MSPEDFRERLRALGLSQTAFARQVSDLAGEPMSLRTVNNWTEGRYGIPTVAAAFLKLLERTTLHKPTGG